MLFLRLAAADLRSDLFHGVCAVALIAALVGPLLLLVGVKSGVTEVLLADLRDAPAKREITFPGDHNFEPKEVDEIRAWPETGFVAPQTAAIITGRISFRNAQNGTRFIRGRAAPTGAGDPLTELGAELASDDVILSQDFARLLDASVGGRVELDLVRYEPDSQRVAPRFVVAAILPGDAGAGRFALFRPETLDRIEAFGHGFALPEWGVERGRDLAARQVVYEKVRLYASDLDTVGTLETRFEKRFHIDARSAVAEIAVFRDLEANLGAALAFVSAAGVGGLLSALAALFWGAVRRKQLLLSMMSLMGARPAMLAAIPVAQSIVVSCCGFIAGLGVYAAFSAAVNHWFADLAPGGSQISTLTAADGGAVFVGLMLTSSTAAALAGRAAMRVDPALAIREG